MSESSLSGAIKIVKCMFCGNMLRYRIIVTTVIKKRVIYEYQNTKRNYIALLLPAVFLPGCGVIDWVKEKFGTTPKTNAGCFHCFSMREPGQVVNDGSEVLVTINGQPIISVKSLNVILKC